MTLFVSFSDCLGMYSMFRMSTAVLYIRKASTAAGYRILQPDSALFCIHLNRIKVHLVLLSEADGVYYWVVAMVTSDITVRQVYSQCHNL